MDTLYWRKRDYVSASNVDKYMMDSIVEMDDGTQIRFSFCVEAFRYAKLKEYERRHSVVGVISRGKYIYEGQSLRLMIRSLDNVSGWLKDGTSCFQTEQ